MINIAKALVLGRVFSKISGGKKLRFGAEESVGLRKSIFTVNCNPVAAKFIESRMGGKKLEGQRIGLFLIE